MLAPSEFSNLLAFGCYRYAVMKTHKILWINRVRWDTLGEDFKLRTWTNETQMPQLLVSRLNGRFQLLPGWGSRRYRRKIYGKRF
jgi:hypothetical protein